MPSKNQTKSRQPFDETHRVAKSFKIRRYLLAGHLEVEKFAKFTLAKLGAIGGHRLCLIYASLTEQVMNKTKCVILILSMGVLVACGEGKYEKMSYSELKDKKRHCDSVPKKSAVFATGCENVDKEIERRKQASREKRK